VSRTRRNTQTNVKTTELAFTLHMMSSSYFINHKSLQRQHSKSTNDILHYWILSIHHKIYAYICITKKTWQNSVFKKIYRTGQPAYLLCTTERQIIKQHRQLTISHQSWYYTLSGTTFLKSIRSHVNCRPIFKIPDRKILKKTHCVVSETSTSHSLCCHTT